MTDGQLNNPHDRFAFFAFHDLNVSRSFIETRLPDTVVRCLDLTTLRVAPGSFVDDMLQSSQSDLLFEVDLRESVITQLAVKGSKSKNSKTVLVYILFEHKSYEEPLLAFQLLKYMVRIWEKLLRENKPLSPIVPIVLYHGESDWRTHRSMTDILSPPAELAGFVPAFEIPLVDLSQIADGGLGIGDPFLQVALLLLKYVRTTSIRERILGLLDTVLHQEEPRLKAVLIYLFSAATKVDRTEMSEVIQNYLHDLGTPLPGSIAELWVNQGIEQGIEQGVVIGQVQLLQRLVGIPISSRDELATCSIDDLSTMLESLQGKLEHQGESQS